MKEQIKKLQSKSIKLGKYKIGLPGSESYKATTPKKIKNVGETLIFVGGAIGIVAGTITVSPVIIMIGGLSSLTGRFFIKMFSNNN